MNFRYPFHHLLGVVIALSGVLALCPSAIRAAEAMPSWPAGVGRVKLSAAWLIERAGLRRGYRKGNVAISTNHTLAIVNCGGGTAAEVVELAREIRGRVRDRFVVTLEPEPVFVNVALLDSWPCSPSSSRP